MSEETPPEITHKTPPGESSIMPCCGRTPFEVPPMDRMAMDDEYVTCPGDHGE